MSGPLAILPYNAGMKTTAVETLRLGEFPNLIWVRVHTDEGVIGLGETFFGAEAVEAYIHESVAPYLLGQGPAAHRQARPRPDAVRRLCLRRRRGARQLGDRHRPLGSLRALGRPADLPAAGRSQPGAHPHLQHLRRLPLRAVAPEAGGRQLGSAGDGGGAEGPYEDLDAFLHRADELALSLREQGITGMKIWPFDPYAEASGGHDISAARSRPGAGAVPQDPGGGRARDGHHGRVPRAVEPADGATHRAGAGGVRALLVRGPAARRQPRRPGDLRRRHPRAGDAERDDRHPLGVPRGRSSAARWGSPCSTSPGAAASRRRRRSPPWPRRYQLPVAPHDCTGPIVLIASTHLSINAPNALIQETVRAYYSGWYRSWSRRCRTSRTARSPRRPARVWAPSCDLSCSSGRMR